MSFADSAHGQQQLLAMACFWIPLRDLCRHRCHSLSSSSSSSTRLQRGVNRLTEELLLRESCGRRGREEDLDYKHVVLSFLRWSVNEEDVFSFIEEENAVMFWQSTDRHTRAGKKKKKKVSNIFWVYFPTFCYAFF